MAAVKAKEKEMKEEKEADRQVGNAPKLRFGIFGAEFANRQGYSLSRINVLGKKRKPGMRSWRRRCTGNELSG